MGRWRKLLDEFEVGDADIALPLPEELSKNSLNLHGTVIFLTVTVTVVVAVLAFLVLFKSELRNRCKMTKAQTGEFFKKIARGACWFFGLLIAAAVGWKLTEWLFTSLFPLPDHQWHGRKITSAYRTYTSYLAASSIAGIAITATAYNSTLRLLRLTIPTNRISQSQGRFQVFARIFPWVAALAVALRVDFEIPNLSIFVLILALVLSTLIRIHAVLTAPTPQKDSAPHE